MKKKFLSAILCAAMGVTMLAGCGSSGGTVEIPVSRHPQKAMIPEKFICLSASRSMRMR